MTRLRVRLARLETSASSAASVEHMTDGELDRTMREQAAKFLADPDALADQPAMRAELEAWLHADAARGE